MSIKIYIAGPVSGHKWDERVAYFAAKAEALRALGHEPVNPLEGQPANTSWADALKHDIPLLVACQGIYLSSGWERSRGARLELHIAVELGLKVLNEEGKDAT